MGKISSKKFIPIGKTKGSKTVRVYLCTWNVGTKPPPDDLTSLLNLDNEDLPDIYAIGLQEVSTGEQSMIDNPWTEKLTATLCPKGYIRFKVVRLSGMLELGFCRRQLFPCINGIESERTKTGLGGWWGNKGGVCIRFDLNGINICIINSHLAAHRDQTPERIIDHNSILEDQKFRDDDVDNILDHDYVLWMGDLNFRIDELPREEVLTRIEKKEYDYLLKYDQLNNTRRQGLAFVDFQEGPISFPPTYKFDVGTNVYDTSEKQRIPAWCDRILWLVHDDSFDGVPLEVKQLHYRHHPEYKISDHRPVTSLFEVKMLSVPQNPLPVTFHNQGQWTIRRDAIVKYNVSVYDASSWDWIGLYKTNFTDVQDYVSWVYAVADAQKLKKPAQVRFTNLDDLKSSIERKHVLMYISSYKNTLLGMSNEFLICA